MLAPYLATMLYELDKEVDKFVNDLLDKGPAIAEIDFHYAIFKIDGVFIEIWIANRWYAYVSSGGIAKEKADETGHFFLTDRRLWDNKRPRRKTMVRLYKYIQANTFKPKPMLTLNEVIQEEK